MNNSKKMWVLCAKDTFGARKVNGFMMGVNYIVQQEFDEEIIENCRKKAWKLLYECDDMEAEFDETYYVVRENGELIGHLYDEEVLWYDDFREGGQYEKAYKNVNGEYVRLGFSRW